MTVEAQSKVPSLLARGYPAPALVVGVGRLGLRVLEQLASDWALSSDAGDDPSVGNLRLIHVRAGHEDDGGAWADDERERRTHRLARALGASDLPTLAVDFALLRSLGLVRFYQGNYEVAVPQTGDLYQRPVTSSADARSAEHAIEVFRRRFFVWERLGADPIGAVERLAVARESHASLELFISPLLGRIRLGSMPRAIVSSILRMRAYRDGRDPTPWADRYAKSVPRGDGELMREPSPLSELFGVEQVAGAARDDAEEAHSIRIPADAGHLFEEHEAWRGSLPLPERPGGALQNLLDNLDRDLVKLDAELRRPDVSAVDRTGLLRKQQERRTDALLGIANLGKNVASLVFTAPSLFAPDPAFQRQAGTGSERAAPRGGLLVDARWVASYLAADMTGGRGTTAYRIFPTSLFRLGMFDYDDTPRADGEAWQGRFAERLRELSEYVEAGLIRLWSDLERDPGVDLREVAGATEYDQKHEAVLQTLALLGEVFVRPLLADEGDHDRARQLSTSPSAASNARGLTSSDAPSPWLARLEHQPTSAGEQERNLLAARLRALGIPAESSEEKAERVLLAGVVLRHADLEFAEVESIDDDIKGRAEGVDGSGLLQLREKLNVAYRLLYAEEFLVRSKALTTPRLTVAVVGDIAEPFVRKTIRTVLREANGELRRSLGPIFSSERGGAEAFVSILPILWAPHPPDASTDLRLEERAREEASIHECIHGLRRWIEAIPRRQRSLRQIYFNDRVTDNAILSDQALVEQTSAFLSLVLRNPIDEDPMLRMVHAGSNGASAFASFACRQLDFPERRARDFLAIQFARAALRHLSRDPGCDTKPIAFQHGPLPANDVSSDAKLELSKLTSARGDGVAAIPGRDVNFSREVEPGELASSFGERLDANVAEGIASAWREIVSPNGAMDGLVERLRARVLADARDKLGRFRRGADDILRESSVDAGVQQAQVDLQTLARSARTTLDKVTGELGEAEANCRANGVPRTDDLKAVRESVQTLALAKPAWAPIERGVALLGGLGLLLGGPIFWAIASALNLHVKPAVLEGVIFHGGPFFAGALVATLAYVLLGRYVDAHLAAIKKTLDGYVNAVRDKVTGKTGSVGSFLDARLGLTTNVARRAHADILRNQADVDARNAVRLQQSVDVQLRALERRLEQLGVRFPSSTAGAKDDVSRLFVGQSGTGPEPLIAPTRVAAYFEESFGTSAAWHEYATSVVNGAGHFERWREAAPLSDTREVIDVGRRQFDKFLCAPVMGYAIDGAFRREATKRVVEFVSARAAHLGFGADFDGLEGLDIDNNVLIKRDMLIVSRACARDIDLEEELARVGHVVRIHEADVRANSVWLLNLANGLSARIIRTLHRYESPLDRPTIMPSEAFPFAMEFIAGDREPINVLSFARSTANLTVPLGCDEGDGGGNGDAVRSPRSVEAHVELPTNPFTETHATEVSDEEGDDSLEPGRDSLTPMATGQHVVEAQATVIRVEEAKAAPPEPPEDDAISLELERTMTSERGPAIAVSLVSQEPEAPRPSVADEVETPEGSP